MNIVLVQSSLFLLLTVLDFPEISAKKSKIKIIVPHKIKYVHHHHTHVLVVKEKKKSHKEPYQHLHYHQEDDKRKKKRNIKHHYYVPFIPQGHDDDDLAEDTMLEYTVAPPSNGALRGGIPGGFDNGFKPLHPSLSFDGKEYEVISRPNKNPTFIDNFYDRSADMMQSSSQKEYYGPDSYYSSSYHPTGYDTYSRNEVDFATEATGRMYQPPSPTEVAIHLATQFDKSFRPITPSYEVFTESALFYPTKPSVFGQRRKKP